MPAANLLRPVRGERNAMHEDSCALTLQEQSALAYLQKVRLSGTCCSRLQPQSLASVA
jgi:hypothetical protein